MDLFSQYKKHSSDSLKLNSQPPATSNKDPSVSQRPTSSSTSSSNQSKQQQFATKVPSEKSLAGSFLKEALTGSPSPKITTSPLAVDNMINTTLNSPKTNTNSSTMKPPPPPPPLPTIAIPTNNTQRSSNSNKSSTNRPSTDFTHHRTDQQVSFFFGSNYRSNFLFRCNNKNHLPIDHHQLHHHHHHHLLLRFHQHLDVQQQDFLLHMNNRYKFSNIDYYLDFILLVKSWSFISSNNSTRTITITAMEFCYITISCCCFG
jgi:hypothetical protein